MTPGARGPKIPQVGWAGGVCVGGGVLAVLCVFVWVCVWVGVGVVVCWMWLPVSGPTLTVVEYEDSQFGTRN